MRSRSRLSLLHVAALIAPLLSALPARADEVRFWTLNFANASENDAFQQIIKNFQAANPGITIVMENRGTDEHKAALRVAGGSNQAPDIYFNWGGLGLGGESVKSGLAAPMDKYYAQYKWDDRFLPPSLSFSKQYPGGRFGVPHTFHGEAIYYNKALFKKAGITTTPTTYAELVAAGDKLAKAGIPAFTFGGTVNWHLMRLMDVLLETQCGAQKHDALMDMKLDWSKEPCATKSFEELKAWADKRTLKPFMGIDQLQSFNLFIAGRAAMMLEGDWLVNQLEAAKKADDYGIFPFPTGTKRLYGFAEYNYISSKSKNPDAAAKFLDYLTSTEVQQAHLGEFGSISVNKQVQYKNPTPLQAVWIKMFGEFDGLFVNGDQAFPLDVTTEFWRLINEVASDKMAPAQAAAALQKFVANKK